jgi:hypothetical protein
MSPDGEPAEPAVPWAVDWGMNRGAEVFGGAELDGLAEGVFELEFHLG